MIIFENSDQGIAARKNLKDFIYKKNLSKFPFFLLLTSENKCLYLPRKLFCKLMYLLGVKKIPFFWMFEDPESLASLEYRNKLDYDLNNYKNFYKRAPNKFLQIKWFNKIGLGVVRSIFYILIYKLRFWYKTPFEYNEILKKLDKDGVVVIPNFLSEEDCKRLQSFLNSSKNEMVTFQNNQSERRCAWLRLMLGNHSDPESIYFADLFRKNKLINSVVKTAARRRIMTLPEVAFFEWRCTGSDVGENHQFDYEDMLHYDVNFPTFKLFYYVNDVTISNGAFVYAKGSHKFTINRLAHDYKISNIYFRMQNGSHVPLSDIDFKTLNLIETPIEGKANSLVLFNAMGFHKRGRFDSEQSRQAILLNYRYLESFSNIIKQLI